MSFTTARRICSPTGTPRLEGTILVPGSSFRNQELQLWAGLAVKHSETSWEFKHIAEMEDLTSADESKYLYDGRQITGADGPHISFRSPNPEQVTGTGFLLRKYVDSKAGSEMMGQSDLAFCRFRYAEVLLNAAEAAWELGEKAKAADYLNEVRRRAGIREIEPDEITGYETFLRERTAEFAFEGLRFYDLKRFRIADKLFDGQADTETALIYGLWPYKVYAPGDPRRRKMDLPPDPQHQAEIPALVPDQELLCLDRPVGFEQQPAAGEESLSGITNGNTP